LIQSKFPDSYLNFNDDRIKKEAASIMEIKAWEISSEDKAHQNNPSNKYDFIMQKVIDSNSPLLVSTDGAHDLLNPGTTLENASTKTTSAFVISTCDIRNGESIETKEWKNRPTLPLLCRATKLPQFIGSTPSDIATGELFGIAMSELSLHQQIPRIIITDSKSTRDLLLELRTNKAIDMIDRNYVRKVAGGVSKFIFHLFQKKFLGMSDTKSDPIPPVLRHSLKAVQHRMCKEALTWTHVDDDIPSNPTAKSSQRVWEATYWDGNQDRTVWKVNSHQLNDEGNRIKSTPRYNNLVPNLCVLSANHHADACADLAKLFHQPTRNIKIAYSLLRFSLMWNGMTIDRNISEVIRKAISVERLKRLQRKPTQGFLHRILKYSTSDWTSFQNNKGLFRSLIGLSRTHSRCLYKNESYRETCRKVRIEQTNNPTEKQLLQVLKNKQDAIKALSSCMWCSHTPHENITAKGNRRHAFLHCSNKEISTFRNDMLDLINSKLTGFIIAMSQTTTWEFSSNLLRSISAQFLFHQKHNTGRLNEVPISRNNLYLPIDELLMKWGKDSIKSAILDNSCSILTEVFGLTPRETFTNCGDEELGVTDLPWLGLTPTFLNSIIIQSCDNLDGNLPHMATKKAISTDLKATWTSIKNINLHRATGLHRIIGTTGKSIEKEFIQLTKTNTIPTNNIISPSIISEESVTPQQQQPPILKHPIINPRNTSRPAKKLKREGSTAKSITLIETPVPAAEQRIQSINDLKTCAGITCGKEAAFWCMDCSHEPGMIKQSIKQCQRCSRFMTALKQAHETISKIQEHSSMNTILQFCKDNPDSLQFRYNKIMDLLDASISKGKKPQQARYTLKSIPDRQKIICRIIHKSLLHHAKETISTDAIFKKSSSFIEQAFINLNQKLFSIKSANKININIEPLLRNNSLIEKYSNSDKSTLSSSQAIATNSSNTYLGGAAIKKAVEVIRNRHTFNVFIAHPDAYLTIEAWEINFGWSNFAKIFSSQRVLDQKPMGVYMIPLFSGSNNKGHWNTLVIEKRRNCCQAWLIDSLGSSELDRNLKNKIRRAFLPGRGRFIWTDHTSRCQTECECGPRTILALHMTESIIAAGGTTARAVEEASLLHLEPSDYRAQSIRLEAALLVEEHHPNMVSRLRRTIDRPTVPGERGTGRKRRRRGHKQKAIRQDAITIDD